MEASKHERIVSAINEKLGSRKLMCPISGDQSSWIVNTSTTSVPAITNPSGPVRPNSPTFPLAVLICQHCGYTLFVNLIQLGLAAELGLSLLVLLLLFWRVRSVADFIADRGIYRLFLEYLYNRRNYCGPWWSNGNLYNVSSLCIRPS